MEIGIIVHSQTGNTLSVAERLMKKLTEAGHRVTIKRVSAVNDEEIDIQKVRLSEKPDIGEYDLLIFGAPVRGFSLSPAMQAYLADVGSLKGKKTACFITEGLPFPWMGGNRSLRQMAELLASKGAEPYGTGIVNWPNAEKREKLIGILTSRLCDFA